MHVEASVKLDCHVDMETPGHVLVLLTATEPTVLITCSLLLPEGWAVDVCSVSVNGKTLKEGDKSRLATWKDAKGLRLDAGDVLAHCWNCTRLEDMN